MRKKSWKRITALSACTALLAGTVAGGVAALPVRASAAARYTVDLEKQLQEFDGWGLSLSWWATEIGDWTRIGSSGKEKREEIAEALYGKSGLNLNIARYNVGGGDDPTHTHMSDDRNTPGWRGATYETRQDPSGHDYTATVVDENYAWVGEDGSELDWTQVPDHRQLWVLDWIQNEHGENGQNDYISEYYSNSPPYWMTMSGCSSGGEGAGQNLDFMYNQDFVEYFLDVYEYLTRQGFRLDNLQPFNESGSFFWGKNGDQEGCYFSPQQKVQILTRLRDEMEERGLDVPYNWGDETNTNVAYEQYNEALGMATTDSEGNRVTGEDVVKGASRYTYHIYWYDVSGAQRFYRTAKQDGKEIYMSEICWSDPADSGEAEYDPDSVTTGFHYTQSIIDTVKHGGVDGYVFWQGMEDMVGQMKGGTNYGLIQGVYYDQEEAEAQGVDLASMGLTYQDFVLSKAYYMSGQYTKYIRPGYTLVDVNENNTLAAISPDGETLVVVKQNNSGDRENFTLDLNGFEAQSVEKVYTDKTHNWAQKAVSSDGKSVTDTVSDHSVTTYIIHGKSLKGAGHFVDESANKKADSLDDIKAAIEENPEVEAYYQTGFSANGGDGKYYGQTSYSKDGTLAYRFYGTGIGLSFLAKSDSGAIDIYIDSDPDAQDATPVNVDLYSATKTPGKFVYRNNTLEEGWHTVYVKAVKGTSGEYSNIDGAFIYTSHDLDAAEKNLAITSAIGLDGTVKFEYTATGLDGFTVCPELYVNGAWTKGEAVTEGTGSFTADTGSVRMRLVAESGSDRITSAEYIVEMLSSTEGVLYFVDCGTAYPESLATGAVLGQLQSVSDRAYGTDAFSGLGWGYSGSFSEGYYASDEAMSSMWSLDKLTGASKIEYTFTIPEAGTYNVALGFFGGGDGWGQRGVKATVGTSEQTATLEENAYTALNFEITTSSENETVLVSVEKATADAQNSHLSLIAITEADVQLPLYTSIASSLNQYVGKKTDIIIGEDLFAELNETAIELYYSDGTHETLADAELSANLTTVTAGQDVEAVFSFEAEGIDCYKTYRWMQEGGSQLYYNIDCGYIQDGTPPDDATEKGLKQSTTHDRKYGSDTTGTSWGYVGDNYDKGVNWANDSHNEWSIREGKDAGQSVSYKMTGFKKNELLRIELAGHCHEWGDRTANISVNGVVVGEWLIKSASGGVITTVTFDGDDVKADDNGELVVKVSKKSGDGPQVGYIKVYSTAPDLPLDGVIAADKTFVEPDDTVNLTGLNPNATVYVYDENDVMTGSFKPEAEECELNVADYLREGTQELHLIQAESNVTNPSNELVLAVAGFDLEIIQESGYVKGGDAAVIRFVPHTTRPITSLTLTTPDGVNYNLMEGFYFRATLNGTYKVTVLSQGVRTEKQFVVENIDTVALNATLSKEGWTDQDVVVTLAPTAVSGIVSVEIDGKAAQAASGKYSFTVTENGEHTVKVVTGAGFEYEETVSVGNIDRTEPTLSLTVNYTAAGVTVEYTATTASGGKLYADFNGTAREITDAKQFTLNEAGKYEIYFTNGLGKSTQKQVYYVTYGTDAKLATVSVGEGGALTVAGKNGTAEAKLYRAGEGEVGSLKAVKAGKYYLDITSGGEHEVVVLNVASDGSLNGLVSEEGGCAGAIETPAAVFGALLIAVAAVAIFVRRRKNS